MTRLFFLGDADPETFRQKHHPRAEREHTSNPVRDGQSEQEIQTEDDEEKCEDDMSHKLSGGSWEGIAPDRLADKFNTQRITLRRVRCHGVLAHWPVAGQIVVSVTRQ